MPGEKTSANLLEGYVGEAQAAIRLKIYAEKAEDEGYPGIARLFRTISESEEIHARNNLRLTDMVKDTETNLSDSLSREEKIAGVKYGEFITAAEEEGESAAVTMFTYARDVEERHAKLYEKALGHLIAEEVPDYYVCGVCGYVADAIVPDKCPICGAPGEKFFKVE